MKLVLVAIPILLLISCIGHANAQHLTVIGPFNFPRPVIIQHKPIDNITSIQNQIQILQGQLKTLQEQRTLEHLKAMKLLQPILAYDQEKGCSVDQHTPTNYKTYLSHFACGYVTVASNGTTYRHFTLIANDYHFVGKPMPITLNEPFTRKDPVVYHMWLFNDSMPGPTMRMTVGDHVTINLINSNESSVAHGLHMHSIHSGLMDGIPSVSPGGAVPPGRNFTFSFIANPAGVFPYHCHMAPVIEHIGRGLYGMMIIDPKTPRPHAQEMVMMLNGYSYNIGGLNGDRGFQASAPCNMQQLRHNLTACENMASDSNEGDNQFYTVNGVAFCYDPTMGGTPIHLNIGTHYRIYLANMLEFDVANNFHIHGTMFYYTSSGSFSSGLQYTDILTLMQGDRGILQFTYPFPGLYMFHSHHNHFSELGWSGFFKVDNDRNYGYFVNDTTN